MPAERDRQRAFRRTLGTRTAALVFFVSTAAAQGVDGPQRIVSINVCTDQLLISLVEPHRIASVSHLSADPYSSWIGADVDGLYLNHGTAEEVIALEPDLVITASFSFRPTVGVLRRLGYPVVELPMAASLDAIASNVLALGEAVGEVERAATLAASLRAEVERLRFRGGGDRPLFVSYEADGWSTGGDSLVADVARAAGFETVGERLGFRDGRRVSLEELLLLEPDLIDLGHPWDEPPALVSESLRHPALQALLARTTVLDVPDPLWICGSARTLEALELLRRAHDAIVLPTDPATRRE